MVVEYEGERVDMRKVLEGRTDMPRHRGPALSWLLRPQLNKCHKCIIFLYFNWRKYLLDLNIRLVAIYNIDMFEFLPQNNRII